MSSAAIFVWRFRGFLVYKLMILCRFYRLSVEKMVKSKRSYQYGQAHRLVQVWAVCECHKEQYIILRMATLLILKTATPKIITIIVLKLEQLGFAKQ